MRIIQRIRYWLSHWLVGELPVAERFEFTSRYAILLDKEDNPLCEVGWDFLDRILRFCHNRLGCPFEDNDRELAREYDEARDKAIVAAGIRAQRDIETMLGLDPYEDCLQSIPVRVCSGSGGRDAWDTGDSGLIDRELDERRLGFEVGRRCES